MNVTGQDCKTTMTCTVSPSEDPQKIGTAITNIFPDCTLQLQTHSVSAVSGSMESLEKIRQSILSRQSQKTYRRSLQKHAYKNSTWFYLNKQAAFAKKIIICEEPDESPLGPIKVVLTSRNIEDVMGWLVDSG